MRQILLPALFILLTTAAYSQTADAWGLLAKTKFEPKFDEKLGEYFEQNPNVAKKVVGKAVDADDDLLAAFDALEQKRVVGMLGDLQEGLVAPHLAAATGMQRSGGARSAHKGQLPLLALTGSAGVRRWCSSTAQNFSSGIRVKSVLSPARTSLARATS